MFSAHLNYVIAKVQCVLWFFSQSTSIITWIAYKNKILSCPSSAGKQRTVALASLRYDPLWFRRRDCVFSCLSRVYTRPVHCLCPVIKVLRRVYRVHLSKSECNAVLYQHLYWPSLKWSPRGKCANWQDLLQGLVLFKIHKCSDLICKLRVWGI